ncbi:enoyl-CoA hydratase/isomerase family protein, partial [Brucella ceti]|uniref:enoyl-CoA hydratase/isomerase family protein n=1 Tax=Brucella ceti TaxID=120577 RepID=UPI0035D3E9EC
MQERADGKPRHNADQKAEQHQKLDRTPHPVRRLMRLLWQIVRRMVLGGEMFTADEALSHGLVDHVVETGEALQAALAYAARVAKRGPAALEISKLMLSVANGEDNGTAVEALGSILAAKTGDLKEGVRSFTEKREANFEGKW